MFNIPPGWTTNTTYIVFVAEFFKPFSWRVRAWSIVTRLRKTLTAILGDAPTDKSREINFICNLTPYLNKYWRPAKTDVGWRVLR